MNENRHVIVEGDELYHYGVKGMKWKDHKYVKKAEETAKKVGSAVKAFGKKVSDYAKSPETQRKAKIVKRKTVSAFNRSKLATKNAAKAAVKESKRAAAYASKKAKEGFDKAASSEFGEAVRRAQHKANVATGYKLRKKGKGMTGKSATGEYREKLISERRKKAAASANALALSLTRQKRNAASTKLAKGTAAAGRKMDRIRNESNRDTQNRNDLNALKKSAKSHVVANNEVAKYKRQDATGRTGLSSAALNAKQSNLSGRINQRDTHGGKTNSYTTYMAKSKTKKKKTPSGR